MTIHLMYEEMALPAGAFPFSVGTYRMERAPVPARQPAEAAPSLAPRDVPDAWRDQVGDALCFHLHRFFEISYVASGKALYIVHNRCVEVSEGDFILFNGNVPHAWIPDRDNPAVQKVMVFYPSLLLFRYLTDASSGYLASLFGATFSFFVCDRAHPMNRELADLLLQAEREYVGRATGYEIMIRARILEFATLLIRLHTPGSLDRDLQPLRESRPLHQALDHIGRNLSEPLSLADAARAARMNPSYFSDFFRRSMGLPFHTYITRLRLGKAVELMNHSDLSLTEIAMACGFSTQSGFYKAFRKVYGACPTDWRRGGGA